MEIVEVIKNVLVDFGAGWVLWLLFFLFAASIAVSVERFLFFRAKSEDLTGLFAALDAHLRSGNQAQALQDLSLARSVGGTVAAAGIRLADRGPVAAEKAMESALAIERKALERRLAFLGTLGNNAPFIGLLGTVIGVVLAFEALGQAPTAAAAGQSQVASQEVMGAIAEALVATAVGIGVALPAVALFNYFQRRIASIMADADAVMNLVVAYLSDLSTRTSTGGLSIPHKDIQDGR